MANGTKQMLSDPGSGAPDIGLGHWGVTHNPGAGVLATITRAAQSSPEGIPLSQIVHSITVAIACAAAAQAPISVQLIDDPAGAATILWECVFACLAGDGRQIVMDNVDFKGTPGKAMKLAFSGAPGGTVLCSVAMGGFDAVV